MDTIFTVQNTDFERLNPQEAMDFFRELLWAEARRLGVPMSKVRISTWIDVPDGGIDAVVDDFSGNSDLVKQGKTGYQIKAGSAFKPWQKNEIKKELFGKELPSRTNLATGVRNCLDKDGTYVLVCFKQDLAESQHRKSIQVIGDYFGQCGYPQAKVEVWSQGNLVGFLRRFPSLSLHLVKKGGSKFQTHYSWSQDAEMRRNFIVGTAQEDVIANIQNELRKNDEAVHIRVYGEPGIGKSRIALEVMRQDDLRPLVVYSSAADFRDSELMNEILRDDNQSSVILVLDECDKDDRAYIWDKLKYKGPRVKLVSIYNEYDDTSGNISYFDIPPLGDNAISSIIQGYGVPKEQTSRWAELCGGSPRVAHVIGWNLKNNPDDLLKPPDTVNIWERYIVAREIKASNF